jgi:hydroxyacylglutathione hydrolase
MVFFARQEVRAGRGRGNGMKGKCEQITERIWWVGRGGWGGALKPLSKPGDCNVFLIDGGDELALVDAGVGPEAPEILANVKATGLSPDDLAAILITHAHGDHSGGAAWLRGVTGASVAAGTVTARALEAADPCLISGMRPFSRPDTEPVHVDKWLEDGEVFYIGDVAVKAIHTPGHTLDATCFLVQDGRKRVLLSGDTAIGNQPRRDLGKKTVVKGMLGWLDAQWSAPVSTYVKSLDKLAALKADLLLPGHGMVNDKATTARGLAAGRKRLTDFLDDREHFMLFSLQR